MVSALPFQFLVDIKGRLPSSFDSADKALSFAMQSVWLSPDLFPRYIDELNNGMSVTYCFGFAVANITPIRPVGQAAPPL